MMKKVFSLALAACFAVASVASAGITGIERLLVDNAAGGTCTSGFITNDIEIEFHWSIHWFPASCSSLANGSHVPRWFW